MIFCLLISAFSLVFSTASSTLVTDLDCESSSLQILDHFYDGGSQLRYDVGPPGLQLSAVNCHTSNGFISHSYLDLGLCVGLSDDGKLESGRNGSFEYNGQCTAAQLRECILTEGILACPTCLKITSGSTVDLGPLVSFATHTFEKRESSGHPANPHYQRPLREISRQETFEETVLECHGLNVLQAFNCMDC